MIWIIGGTTETRQVIRELEGKKDYMVTVATYSGAEMLGIRDVQVGRMDAQAMAGFIKEKKIHLVIDMSHPYALEASQNAKTACKETGTEYIRFKRRGSELEGCIFADSLEQCLEYLKSIRGTVFFTTGIKNIKDFEKIRGSNRFIYRVLPSSFSIQECITNQLKMQDIVAILGPVSEDLNYQLFKDYGVDYVVTKDSGKEGGTEEKLQACKRLGIPAVVIGRQPEDYGIEDMTQLLEMIK